MKKILFTLLLLNSFFAGETPVFALDQIIRPYQTMRSEGMGGVRITTGEYEENFWGNPARVADNPTWRITLLDLSAETSSDTLSHINDLQHIKSDNLQPIADTVGTNLHGRIETAMPAVYRPNRTGKNAWAVALLTSTQIDVIARRSYSVDPTTIIDIGPSFSFARRYMPENALRVGMTAHLAYRASTRKDYSLMDVVQGASFSPKKNGDNGTMLDFDLGAMFDFTHWHPHDLHFSAGLAVNNLLDGRYGNISFHPIKNIGTSPRQQPRSIGVGGSVTRESLSLGIIKLTNLVAALEFSDIGNNKNGSMFRTIHFGGEFRFKQLRPRLGIYQGYPTAGLGLDLKLVSIDFATYAEEMALNAGDKEDRRIALHFAVHL